MSRRPLKAVAWDIDGTLIDSEPLHHRALVAASRTFGADLSDLPDQAFRGIHMGDVWKQVLPRMPAETAEADWAARIDAHYVDNRASLIALPGAVATIRALAARGVAHACVSNSSRSVVDANIAALGIADAISFSISLDDVAHGKPDPEPYRRACERLGLPPESVVAVEDSFSGALSACAAGLYVVGYTPSGGGFESVDLEIDRLESLLALFA
ncbi:HAD superfamily hydrolase (TIGR01509 family) [Ancylobacter aquaticus]|uniref:HAD superfamily hydrolase (TIGR01509 family) n=1 Tax=Ancylobacter aquaticus TaxID=100 RepID=A0A4R1I7V0_ANCAQ|nr:HAD family phosphatase [Ancylobacter aquaticus]TCK30211.1 HAD superfamily hydrolase (TIGR01509 family) [Ancylobacter aquaticus]